MSRVLDKYGIPGQGVTELDCSDDANVDLKGEPLSDGRLYMVVGHSPAGKEHSSIPIVIKKEDVPLILDMCMVAMKHGAKLG